MLNLNINLNIKRKVNLQFLETDITDQVCILLHKISAYFFCDGLLAYMGQINLNSNLEFCVILLVAYPWSKNQYCEYSDRMI